MKNRKMWATAISGCIAVVLLTLAPGQLLAGVVRVLEEERQDQVRVLEEERQDQARVRRLEAAGCVSDNFLCWTEDVASNPDYNPTDPPFCTGRESGGKLRGLLIGVGRYGEYKGTIVPSLNGGAPDARLLQNLFLAINPEADITLLADDDATPGRIVEAARSLIASAGCGDTVVISLSGQAQADPVMGYYFLPVDAKEPVLDHLYLDRLVTACRNRGAFVVTIVDTVSSDKVVISSSDVRYGDSRRTASLLLPGSGDFALFTGGPLPWEMRTDDGLFFGQLTWGFAASVRTNPAVKIADLAQEIVANQGRNNNGVTTSNPNATPFAFGKSRGPAAGEIKIRFDRPAPSRGATRIKERSVSVEGAVETAKAVLKVFVNTTEARLSPDGRFSIDLQLLPGRREITAFAVLRDMSTAYGSIEVEVDDGALAPAGKRYALVIGNQNYKHWTPLDTPIGDVDAVATLLRDRFGFSLELPPLSEGAKPFSLILHDADRKGINRALSYLEKALGADDSLVIFYAGHGYYEPKAAVGYWIPVDAATDNSEGEWISSYDLNTALKKLSARHVLVVSDSCFAGTLAGRGDKPARPVETKDPAERRRWLGASMNRASRYLLTSGAKEQVADKGGEGHSIFARAFLKGLEDYPEEAFTMDEVYATTIKPSVLGNSDGPGQSPQYVYLGGAGEDGGQLVFMRTPKAP